MRSSVPCAIVLLSFCPALASQTNPKPLFNTKYTSRVTRPGASGADQVYVVLPELHRLHNGAITGIDVRLTDQEQSTAETIEVGVVKLTNGVPDTSASGELASTSKQAFGSGSGKATQVVRFLFPKKVTLTSQVALRVTLSPPKNWPSDGVAVHVQEGNTTKVPGAVPRVQQTWSRNLPNGALSSWLKPGSYVDIAALYEQPVVGTFVSSTAYGPREDLFGPEALYPESSRGDQIGWYIHADQHPGNVALLMISLGKATPALPTPFGLILISPATVQAIPGAFVLDSNGSFQSATIPVPNLKATIWYQSALLDFKTLGITTTDAGGFQIL